MRMCAEAAVDGACGAGCFLVSTSAAGCDRNAWAADFCELAALAEILLTASIIFYDPNATAAFDCPSCIAVRSSPDLLLRTEAL